MAEEVAGGNNEKKNQPPKESASDKPLEERGIAFSKVEEAELAVNSLLQESRAHDSDFIANYAADVNSATNLAGLTTAEAPKRLVRLKGILTNLDSQYNIPSFTTRLQEATKVAQEALLRRITNPDAAEDAVDKTIPNPALAALSEKNRNDLLKRILDLSNHQVQIENNLKNITDAKLTIQQAIRAIEDQQQQEGDKQKGVKKSVEAILEEDIARINKERPGKFAQALQHYNRQAVPRMVAGLGISLLNTIPGVQPFGLVAKGLMSVAGAAAGGDALATNKVEQSGLRLFQEEVAAAGKDGFVEVGVVEKRVKDLIKNTPPAERDNMLKNILSAYGELTYISNARGLKISAELAKNEQKARSEDNVERQKSGFYRGLDAMRSKVQGMHPVGRVLTGLGVAGVATAATVFGGGLGLLGAMALNGAYAVANSRKMETKEKAYQHSGVVEGIKQALGSLATDPQYAPLIQGHLVGQTLTNAEKGTIAMGGAIGEARAQATDRRKKMALGFAGAAAAMQGIMGSREWWLHRGDSSVEAPEAPASSGSQANTTNFESLSKTGGGGENLGEQLPQGSPENIRPETLNINSTEEINQWRVAHNLPLVKDASLYFENATEAAKFGTSTPSHNLAEQVVKGYLDKTGGQGNYTDEQKSAAIAALENRWKSENLFSADGSLNPDMRDDLRFEINGMKDAEEAFKGMTPPQGEGQINIDNELQNSSPRHPSDIAYNGDESGFERNTDVAYGQQDMESESQGGSDRGGLFDGQGDTLPAENSADTPAASNQPLGMESFSPSAFNVEQVQQQASLGIESAERAESAMRNSFVPDVNLKGEINTLLKGHVDQLIQKTPNKELLLEKIQHISGGIDRYAEYSSSRLDLIPLTDPDFIALRESGFDKLIDAKLETKGPISLRLQEIYRLISKG